MSRDLRDRLRDLRVDPPDGGFSAALHRKLVAAGEPLPPPWWRRPFLTGQRRWLWPAFGAVAGLAVFLVLSQQRAEPATQLPATKVAVVRVNLSAEVAVQSAEIRVTLPDGLVFWADGKELPQRSFEWTQPLAKGDNDIPIAVRGVRPGRYKMTVTARIGGEKIEDEVVLEVTSG